MIHETFITILLVTSWDNSVSYMSNCNCSLWKNDFVLNLMTKDDKKCKFHRCVSLIHIHHSLNSNTQTFNYKKKKKLVQLLSIILQKIVPWKQYIILLKKWDTLLIQTPKQNKSKIFQGEHLAAHLGFLQTKVWISSHSSTKLY